MKTRTRLRLLALTLAFPMMGCPDEEEGPVGGTDGPEQSVCNTCPDDYWVCQCTNIDPVQGCGYDYDACFDFCDDESEDYVDNGRVTCSSASPLGTCTTWDPPAKVDFVAGVYEVDEDFMELLSTSGRAAPLWTCDDATVESIAGGFEIDNASQGELLYELGLRNGDKPQTVNGISVTTWDGAFEAYTEYLGGETDFTVVVTRNGQSTTLQYELVP